MFIWKKVSNGGEWPLYEDKREQSPQFGRFCVQPLEKGFGMIVGKTWGASITENLPGPAVSALKFQFHEKIGNDLTRRGIILKNVIEGLEKVRCTSLGRFPLLGTTQKHGPGLVFSSDLTFKIPTQITSEKSVLAELNCNEVLDLSVLIHWGRGSVDSKSSEIEISKGWLPLNRSHSPARCVGMKVLPIEVGTHVGFEQLIIEVVTDGTVSPEDAIRRAGQKLKLPIIH